MEKKSVGDLIHAEMERLKAELAKSQKSERIYIGIAAATQKDVIELFVALLPFLRCPHCDGQVQHSGDDFTVECPGCQEEMNWREASPTAR